MSSHYDPTDLAATDAALAEKAEQEKRERDSEEADLRWLMGSKRGRRIVWRQLGLAGVFKLSFNTNAMQMAFAEGNRNAGLRTVALIHQSCPELYPTMVKEAANERNADNGNGRNDH